MSWAGLGGLLGPSSCQAGCCVFMQRNITAVIKGGAVFTAKSRVGVDTWKKKGRIGTTCQFLREPVEDGESQAHVHPPLEGSRDLGKDFGLTMAHLPEHWFRGH